jgi:hypothetical protein
VPIIDTTALVRPAFQPDQFTPTKFTTSEEKAKFANALCEFIARDFPERLFTKSLYSRLSNTFGHIAHYDCSGFWRTYFTCTADKLQFLSDTITWWPVGQPDHTFCDVERQVLIRLRHCNLLASYKQIVAAETEATERALLQRLTDKYDSGDVNAEVTQVVFHTAAIRHSTRAAQNQNQQTLF